MLRRVIKSLRSGICVALCVSGVIVAPLAGAELWKYSVQGPGVSSNGEMFDISGLMIIDGSVREWHTNSVRDAPCNCQNAFYISQFDFHVGDLHFFGGGPLSQSNSIYFETRDLVPGSFEWGAIDWFLSGSGDFTSWYGMYSRGFLNSDGTRASVQDIFEAPPELLNLSILFTNPDILVPTNPSPGGGSTTYGIVLDFARISPIPEPEIYAMLGVGLGLIGWVGRRKKLKERAAA